MFVLEDRQALSSLFTSRFPHFDLMLKYWWLIYLNVVLSFFLHSAVSGMIALVQTGRSVGDSGG